MTGPSLTHRNQGDNLLYFVVGDIIRSAYEGKAQITAFSATAEPGRIAAQAPWLRIVNPRRNMLRAMAVLIGTNVYVIAGAIPFHDNVRLMAQQLLYALVVRLRGGTVVVHAVSVQPISKRSCRLLFRWTSRLATEFSVRDEGARIKAEQLGARPPVTRVVDPGFMGRPAPTETVDRLWRQERLPEGVPVCGIGPHLFVNNSAYADSRYDFRIEYDEYSDDELDAYYDSLAATADLLAERGPVVFVSLSTRMPPGDDRVACDWIIERMKRPECAHVVRGEYSAAELMGMLGRLDLYVSTRLHGYALAVGAGVPTVAIEFHPKMRGFAEELGVDDWVVPMRGISAAGVSSTCDSVLADLPASRVRLEEQLRAATDRATAQLVAAMPPMRR